MILHFSVHNRKIKTFLVMHEHLKHLLPTWTKGRATIKHYYFIYLYGTYICCRTFNHGNDAGSILVSPFLSIELLSLKKHMYDIMYCKDKKYGLELNRYKPVSYKGKFSQNSLWAYSRKYNECFGQLSCNAHQICYYV